MDDFFAGYAFIGLVVFTVYVLISLILGLILGKIIKKIWISIPVILIMITLFYFFDLDKLPYFILILIIATVATNFFKKLKINKNETN